MQIYKDMNIGTAKVLEDEMQGIKHYMLDIISPEERYSVSDFKKQSEKCIEQILQKGKMPIICGGTGLYINSLIYGIEFANEEIDMKYREHLNEIAQNEGLENLYKKALEIDPEAANKISKNDQKRIIRILEIYHKTGKTKTQQDLESRKNEVKYDYNVNDYVQLGKYEDIAVTVDKTSIENQLVDDKIAEDIENNTTYSEVSRGAVDGDQILVTYVATSSGSQSTGLSNTDGVTMILGKDKLGLDIEELDEALYGMKAGETKVMVIDLPETYSNTVYAGTKVVFELTVQTVSQPNVPMLTNAYVKETFGYDTIEEYRASVKDSLASTIDSKVDDEIQKQVLSTLQDTCKVSGYPDTLLSTLRDRYDQSVGFYADFTNQSKEEYCQQLYGMSYDDFIKKSAAQQLIMEAIVKDQKFSMREYDYKGDLDEFAGDNGYSDENAFVEKFGKDSVVKAMLVQKAQDYVIDHANIAYK